MVENGLDGAQVLPWMQKRLSCLAVGAVNLGAIFLILLAFGSLIALLIAVTSPAQDLTGTLIGVILPLILLGGSILGMVKLWPLLSYGSDFKTIPVGTTEIGKPFETRFQRAGGGSSFIEKGTVRFEADQLVVDGMLGPSPWITLGVVLVVTILPLVFFGCGLGLIPALLIAYFIGRKKMVAHIPYREISALTVDARTVKMSRTHGKPDRISFLVSSVDGERLYRELRLHYPQAVSFWTNTFPVIS